MSYQFIIKILFSILLIFNGQVLFAQDLLSKSDAVEILLEKNYGIKVAKNNRLISENNTSKKANAYLPTIDFSVGSNANLGGSNQKFNSGMEASVSNAFTWGANTSLGANYTLYNKQRDARLEQLKEIVELSDIEIRQSIELNLIQLFNGYYEIAKLAENVSLLRETIELGKQRLKRANYRYEYGQGLKIDILNAQVDIQRDSINYLLANQQFENSKRNFNFIIGQPVDFDFRVDTTITYAEGLSLDLLLKDVETKNININLADKNLDITYQDLRIIEAGKKPIIGSSASYAYNYSDNAAESFITSSNNRGFALGVNLAWNIFDGGAREIQKQNTEIAIQNQQVLREQTMESLRRDVVNAWKTYQNALLVLEVEKSNLAINQLNFERTQDLFNAAQLTSVEFRQAQLNLLNAKTSYNTAKYDAKIIEIQLLQLSGEIIDTEF